MANDAMNAMILRAARRGQGIVARMGGVSDITHERRELLHAAIADAERAIKRGDEVAREMAEVRIDALLDEARNARQAQEPSAPASGFDGGVRRSINRQPPPNMNGLIRRSVAERDAIAALARESV